MPCLSLGSRHTLYGIRLFQLNDEQSLEFTLTSCCTVKYLIVAIEDPKTCQCADYSCRYTKSFRRLLEEKTHSFTGKICQIRQGEELTNDCDQHRIKSGVGIRLALTQVRDGSFKRSSKYSKELELNTINMEQAGLCFANCCCFSKWIEKSKFTGYK